MRGVFQEIVVISSLPYFKGYLRAFLKAKTNKNGFKTVVRNQSWYKLPRLNNTTDYTNPASDFCNLDHHQKNTSCLYPKTYR